MITFDELRLNYLSILDIPYFELIKSKEWFDRRESIITRDGYKCSTCDKLPTMPHYDIESRKTFHLWFGEDKLVYLKNEKGYFEESYMPEIKIADKAYSLHVHHKLYIVGKLPWEYTDDDLITLCNWCHWDFHEKNIVPVFRSVNDKMEQLDINPCFRCNAAGWFPEYSHVYSGICFRCKGARYEELIEH